MSWARHGECNGCGDCCRTIAAHAIVRDPGQVRDRAFYDARGFEEVQVDGQPRLVLLAKLVAPCPKLDGDRCGIYEARPQTCRDYPQLPLLVVGTPCSHWFERAGVRIGGLGSPYPSTAADLRNAEAVH